MKILLKIILITSLSQSVYASNDSPRFKITSNCVLSTDVIDSNIGLGWTLVINLDEKTANELLKFSKKNLKKHVRLIDGNNNEIIKNGTRIQSHISTPIHVSGLNSKEEALAGKNNILSSNGKCGVK